MRLDHVAYRTTSRLKTAQFFIDAFGYKIQQKFQIPFDDGTTADCIALEPPEKVISDMPFSIEAGGDMFYNQIYHLAPEIFCSDGPPGSIVGDWVAIHGPGIHHMAYQVDDVEAVMREWQKKGYAEFSSDKPLTCKDGSLTQVFSKPSVLTGVVFELIKLGSHGFCSENVKALMESTRHG